MKTSQAKPRKSGSAAKAPAKASSPRISEEERDAIREWQRERKGGVSQANGEQEVLAKIASMPQPDRVIAERVHAIVRSTVPSLTPRTWYGMPAYANDKGVVCFFQNASKFKTRYSTLGFSDKARLDDGNMWPTAFALDKLAAQDEQRIIELIRRATS